MSPPDDFDEIVDGGPPSDKRDEKIAELEGKLEATRDERNEERFIWILVLMIVFNAGVFPHMQNFGGPTGILVIELILLVVLGRRLGVDDIKMITDKILDKLPIGK